MKQVCMMQYTTPGTLDLQVQFEGLKTLSLRNTIHLLPQRKVTMQCCLLWMCVHIENTDKGKSPLGI